MDIACIENFMPCLPSSLFQRIKEGKDRKILELKYSDIDISVVVPYMWVHVDHRSPSASNGLDEFVSRSEFGCTCPQTSKRDNSCT